MTSGCLWRNDSRLSVRLAAEPMYSRSSQSDSTFAKPSSTIGCDSQANTERRFTQFPLEGLDRPWTQGGVGTKCRFGTRRIAGPLPCRLFTRVGRTACYNLPRTSRTQTLAPRRREYLPVA